MKRALAHIHHPNAPSRVRNAAHVHTANPRRRRQRKRETCPSSYCGSDSPNRSTNTACEHICVYSSFGCVYTEKSNKTVSMYTKRVLYTHSRTQSSNSHHQLSLKFVHVQRSHIRGGCAGICEHTARGGGRARLPAPNSIDAKSQTTIAITDVPAATAATAATNRNATHFTPSGERFGKYVDGWGRVCAPRTQTER